jgi:diaminobutyrate-2-oxoglutarate transaminase
MSIGPEIQELHFPDAPAVDTIPGPNSQKLVDQQIQREPLTTSYPRTLPLAIDEARGATIRDIDGNIFLDFFGGIGVMNVGHSNPYVLEGVHNQIDRCVQTVDFPTKTRIEFLEALDRIAPGGLSGDSNIAVGGPTGANAIEATIKLAREHTGGDELLAFRGSYHGGSLGALSLSSTGAYKQPYTPLLANTTFLPYPDQSTASTGPEATVDYALRETRETLAGPHSGVSNPAGIWVEPIQGTGGVTIPPAEFLEGLQAICEEHSIPLITDEIQTGFGRTGQWFATEWHDVTPDMTTMAKSLGGIGFPLSATIYNNSMDSIEAGFHGGTFRGHTAGMRASLRAMEYIEAHDLLSRASELGEAIVNRLRTVAEEVSEIGDVRGKGLMIGIEFVTDDNEPAPAIKRDVRQRCFERGLLVWTAGSHGHVIRLLPPLVLTRSQADQGVDLLTSAIRDATK